MTCCISRPQLESIPLSPAGWLGGRDVRYSNNGRHSTSCSSSSSSSRSWFFLLICRTVFLFCCCCIFSVFGCLVFLNRQQAERNHARGRGLRVLGRVIVFFFFLFFFSSAPSICSLLCWLVELVFLFLVFFFLLLVKSWKAFAWMFFNRMNEWMNENRKITRQPTNLLGGIRHLLLYVVTGEQKKVGLVSVYNLRAHRCFLLFFRWKCL